MTMKKAIQMWVKFTTEVLEQDKLETAMKSFVYNFRTYKAEQSNSKFDTGIITS